MRIVTPVRFVFKGDIERAKSHISLARVMLGQMDARSSNPFMNWPRSLPDGTEMRLINNAGQRMAVIDSPGVVAAPEEPTAAAAAASGFGFLTEDGTWIYSVDRGVTWQAGTSMPIGADFPARPFVSLTLPDGETVCFVGLDDIFTLSADGTGWTDTGNINNPPDAFTNAADTDGSIIVYTGNLGGTTHTENGIQDSFGWAPVGDLSDWTQLFASESLSSNESPGTSIAHGGAAGWVMTTAQGDVFVSPDGLTDWTVQFDGQALGFWADINGAYRWNGNWYLYGRWFVSPSGRMIRKYDDSWSLIDTTTLQFVNLEYYRPVGNSSILAMVDLVDSNTVSVRQSTDGETWTTALTRDLNNNQFAPKGSGVVAGEDILLTYSHIVSGVANYGVFVHADGAWTDVTDDVTPLIGSGGGTAKRIRTAVSFIVS